MISRLMLCFGHIKEDTFPQNVGDTLTGQRPGPEWVCLELAVVGGFLTLCRKDFTTGVWVTMRTHLLKLRTMKQGRG